MSNPVTPITISEAARRIGDIFCRTTNAALIFDTPHDLPPGADAERKIVETALQLIARGDKPDLANLVMAGAGTYDELHARATRATYDVQQQLASYARQIRLAALQRRGLETLERLHRELQLADLFGVEEKIGQLQQDITMLERGIVDSTLYDAGSIVDTFAEQEALEPPLPLPYPALYDHLGGGLHKGHVVVITGSPGARKTTFAAYNILSDLANRGHKALHLAHDGGSGREHVLRYITVEWAKECYAQRVPDQVRMQSPHGPVIRSFVHPLQTAALLRGDDPDIPVTENGRACFYTALARVRNWRPDKSEGWVRIVDAKALRGRMSEITKHIIATKLEYGLDVMLMDHMLQVQGDGRDRNERSEDVVRQFCLLKDDWNLAFLAIAHRTRSGNTGEQVQGVANLSFMSALEQEAHAIFALKVNPDTPTALTVNVSKSRFDVSGVGVDLVLTMSPSSGFIRG